MSISDYSELVTEVVHRSGVSDVANRASMYVGMAERMLEKQLRTSDMEVSTTLTTDATGTVAMPTDHLETRSVRARDAELSKIPLTSFLHGYRCGYSVQGSSLLSSYAETDHSMVYYARLPSLVVNGTNWLLEKEPEIYLNAFLFQVYQATGALEQAQTTAAYLGPLLEAVNAADHMDRLAGTHIDFRGLMV